MFGHGHACHRDHPSNKAAYHTRTLEPRVEQPFRVMTCLDWLIRIASQVCFAFFCVTLGSTRNVPRFLLRLARDPCAKGERMGKGGEA